MGRDEKRGLAGRGLEDCFWINDGEIDNAVRVSCDDDL